MTSYFKAFGLALIAAFAFSAVAASGASAVEKHHFNGTVNDEVTVQSENHQRFESTTGSNEGYICGSVHATGQIEEATQTYLTVEPQFSECQAFEESPETEGGPLITVTTNGCHFKFTGETTTGNPTPGEGKHASVDIICPPEQVIEIHVTELNLKCSHIGEQTVEDAVRYKNETTEPGGEPKYTHITIEATAHGIVSTTTKFCGEGTHTNGSYTGNATVTAPNGISLSTTEE